MESEINYLVSLLKSQTGQIEEPSAAPTDQDDSELRSTIEKQSAGISYLIKLLTT